MQLPNNWQAEVLRNLYAGQEATVRTGHGTTDWFQIGKGIRHGCVEELKSLLMKVKEAFEFLFTFCHKGGVICLSEVIDIFPGNLDSSLCFFQPSVSHDVLCIEVKQAG